MAQAPVDGAWPVDVVESGVSLRLKVDARVGRVTSVDVGRSDGPTHAQLERIARYASNPAADRARTRRRLLTLVVIVVAVGGGLLLARRLRLREEAAQSSDGEPNGGA